MPQTEDVLLCSLAKNADESIGFSVVFRGNTFAIYRIIPSDNGECRVLLCRLGPTESLAKAIEKTVLCYANTSEICECE